MISGNREQNMDVQTHSILSNPKIRIGLIAISAALFVGIPFWNLSTFPAYRNALILPQTWQGGIEVIVVACLLMLAQRIGSSLRCALAMAAIVELYWRRHGVDLAAVIDLAYFESIAMIGVAASRWSGAPIPSRLADYLRIFVLGFGIWSVCAWTISAFGFGSVNALRALSLLLALAALTSRPRPMSAFVFARWMTLSLRERCLAALVLTWMLVLFAKTATALNFDALWYPLRGEYVLVGDGSAFKQMGLVSAVYYFPKLYELFLIPVSALGSASSISGMTVLLFGTFSIACYVLLGQLGVANRIARLVMVLACVTLPALSNSALDPKPDFLAALLLILTWSQAIRFIESRTVGDGCWFAACTILATQAKLPAIAYAGLLVVVTIAMMFVARRTQTPSPADTHPRTARIALVIAVATALFVTGRTLWLTGMPTIGPDVFFHAWQKLGFSLKDPTGTLNWNSAPNWSDAPTLAVDLVFRPQRLLHIVNYWTGDIWLWLGALALMYLSRKNSVHWTVRLVGLSLAAAGLYLMFGVGYGIRGSDGNYFLAAIASATIIGAACVWHRMTSDSQRNALLVCLAVFASFQAAYSFMSSNWATGTHAFDLNFHRGFHTLRREDRELFVANGMGEIETHLRHLHHAVRVVSCIDDNLSMRLPARGESVQQMSYSRTDYFASPQKFLDYLAANKIRFLIMPHADNTSALCVDLPAAKIAAKQLADDRSVDTIDDAGYVMYDLTRWLAQQPEKH